MDPKNKPFYIGFGSMVIANPQRFIRIVTEAAKLANCRVLMQSGWTKFGEDFELLTEQVMVIGPMPHDYLFEQVAGVVHHGGAGTTSAGMVVVMQALHMFSPTSTRCVLVLN